MTFTRMTITHLSCFLLLNLKKKRMTNNAFIHFDFSYPSLQMFTKVVEVIALLFIPPFKTNGIVFNYNQRHVNGTTVLNNVVLHFVLPIDTFH